LRTVIQGGFRIIDIAAVLVESKGDRILRGAEGKCYITGCITGVDECGQINVISEIQVFGEPGRETGTVIQIAHDIAGIRSAAQS